MTIAILNNFKTISMYARVPHSESSIFVGFLASTSFALCNNKLLTIVLMCLCLQNKYITSIIVNTEFMEDVDMKIFVDLIIFSKTELKFVGRQAFARIKHGFFWV